MRKLVLLLVLLGVIVAFSGTVNAGLTDGLVGYWPFDGNADDSIGTNHGTLIGTAAITATGGLANSGYVSVGPGSNYVNLQDTAGLAEWTISAWVNNANTVGYAALAAGWEADDSWYDIRLGQHGTTDRSELGLTDGPSNQNGHYDGATINGVTEWTHIAFTGGATDSTLYINGVQQGVLTYADFVNGDGLEFSFLLSYDRLGAMGEYETYGAGTFDLDEVGIWDRTLTDEEIQDLWNSGQGTQLFLPSDPSPGYGETVLINENLELSWTNMEPNNPGDPVFVEVLFGTEPNELHPGYDMIKVVDAATTGLNTESVIVDASISDTYYWQINSYVNGVDHINDSNMIEGSLWLFYAIDDVPPTVEIHTLDQMTWSGEGVPIDATVTDDAGSELTIAWTVDDDSFDDPNLTIEIGSADQADTTVTITKTGPTDDVVTVTMTVTVSDAGNPTESDTASMEIDVYNDACHMARVGEEKPVADTDLLVDCTTNVDDLNLQVATWLINNSLLAPTASTDQSEPAGVLNGDFETLYKPGTTITGIISDGGWAAGVGPDTPISSGTYEFADGTTGDFADIPGWLVYTGGGLTSEANHTDGGRHCIVANGSNWGNPDGGLIVSAASLGHVNSGTYTLSMMINHAGPNPATPIVLDLLADGVAVAPTSLLDSPVDGANWVEISRTYEPNDLGSNAIQDHLGKSLTIMVGVGSPAVGMQTRFDDISLDFQIESENLPSVDAGLNMVTWTDELVTLNPTVNDNNGGAGTMTYLWTAEPGDGVVFDPQGSDPNNSEAKAPTVTITKAAGDMVSVKLVLAVTLEGVGLVSNDMTIDVYDNPCLAAKGENPQAINLGDINEDCITNFIDFAQLALEWLDDYNSSGPLDRL